MKITQFDDTYTQKVGAGETTLVSGSSGGSNSAFGGDVVGSAGSLSVVGLRQRVSLSSNMGDNTVGTVLTTIQSSPWLAAFAVSSNSGSVSYASNSNDVGNASAAGASSLVSRGDHVHKGLRSIAKSGSSALFGDVTLTGGTNVTLTQSGQDISIASTGGGGGMSQSYLGYNTIGGTWQTVTNNREYMKKISPGSSINLQSIGIYIRPGVDNVLGISVAILTDSAGSPDKIIAANACGAGAMYFSNSASMPGAGRWVDIPLGGLYAAGDYWLAVMFEKSFVDLAKDGSGTDRFFTSSLFTVSGTYPSAFAITTTTDAYSIRASVFS